MQVNYPHEALLFKQIAQFLANFLISFVMNIAVLLFFKVVPSWGIFLFPIVALPLLFLGVAMGLIVAMIAVVAVDLNSFIGIGMRLLMWATPVVYSSQIENPYLQLAIRWNPLAYLVCSCRDIIIYGRLYHPTGYFIAATLSFIAFMISWRLFYVSEDRLIERMV
jgi:ABC-type polysaccharide/polyol phosphate export permease